MYRHMEKPMAAVSGRNKPGGRGGRPRKRTGRKIVTALLKLRKTEGTFTSRDIQGEAGIPENQLSTRALQRYLKEMGYGYNQCRRKGIPLKEDLDRRLKFAMKCQRLPTTFWKE